MILSRRALIVCLALLTLLRFIAAGVLPLSADEAYYWLWSRHLQPGYYDHPPLIAYLIRAGTFLFGNGEFGVRVFCVLLSVVATWFTYAAGCVLLDNEKRALGAALIFNLTLMVAVESMVATPDAPVLAAAAAFVFALAKVSETKDPRWWLFAGVAAGIGLLAKYTMFFLGAGALVWLFLAPAERHWLRSIWPYIGGIIAFVIFAPNLWWNAENDWLTFVFQFGRTAAHGFNPVFLVEFVAAQAGLATPLILIAGLIGLARLSGDRSERLFLLPALCAPAFVYFLWHGLHDRVQGNWPSFLYPLLAISVIFAFNQSFTGWREKLILFCRFGAMALATILLAAIYAQAFFALVSAGRGDPVSRLLAYNIGDLVDHIQEIREREKAKALLTTDYATTAWLSFYAPGLVVMPLGEPDRWRFAPKADPALIRGPLVYVTETRRDAKPLVTSLFGKVGEIAWLFRTRNNVAITQYTVYRVREPRAELFLPRP